VFVVFLIEVPGVLLAGFNHVKLIIIQPPDAF
jgi:hypothetical protein